MRSEDRLAGSEDRRVRSGEDGGFEVVELGELVLGEGFGWEEVERPGGWVGEKIVDDGQVVAERLAAGGWGDHDDVFATACGMPAGGLVAVERIDATRAQRSRKRGIEFSGQRVESGRLGWQNLPGGYVAHEHRVEPQVADQRFDRHEGIISERWIRASGEVRLHQSRIGGMKGSELVAYRPLIL